LLAAPLVGLGASVFGPEGAWRMPFLAPGAAAVAIGFGMSRFFRRQGGEHAFRPAYPAALAELGKFTLVQGLLTVAFGLHVMNGGQTWCQASLFPGRPSDCGT
jgi:hypothetical protein